MNTAEASVIRFLMKCRDDGLDVPGIGARVKVASVKIANPAVGAGLATAAGKGLSTAAGKGYGYAERGVGAGLSTAWDLAKSLGKLGLFGAAVGPAAIGAGAGYGLAQLGGPDYGPEDVKAEEQIAAYRQAIAELARTRRQHAGR